MPWRAVDRPDASAAEAVPSYADTLRLQEDLERFCADRPLPGRELFADNPLYGHARVVRTYAGLPQGRPLRIAIPHGVSKDRIVPFYSRRELVPVLTYTRASDREQARRQGVRGRLCGFPSPFVLAMQLAPDDGRRRSGTLFFPCHSTQATPADVDFRELAASLLLLPPERQPVTVCLYWRDVQLGHHRIFEEAGIKTVSAGHMHDEDFLFHLRNLLGAHEFAASNELGSHVFYAMYAGCTFFEHGVGRRDAWAVDELLDPESARLLPDLTGAQQWVQRTCAARYLGEPYLQPPRATRSLLRRAELLDVMGLLEPDAAEAPVPTVPAAARRAARRVVRRVLRRHDGRA